MTEHPRLRNIGVLIVLVLVFVIPAMFISPNHMMDLASGPMLVFSCYALFLIASEAWEAFWVGKSDRTAFALFGLSLLFSSIIVMRSYGLLTRNISGMAWLEDTYLYAAAIYCQFVGVFLFSRASAAPSVKPRSVGVGQLMAGVIIGAVVASSKVLEPALAMVGKLLGGLVR